MGEYRNARVVNMTQQEELMDAAEKGNRDLVLRLISVRLVHSPREHPKASFLALAHSSHLPAHQWKGRAFSVNARYRQIQRAARASNAMEPFRTNHDLKLLRGEFG